MVTSTLSGASGTGRISSTVSRERNHWVSPGSWSISTRPTSAVGGPPCSEPGSHGPTAMGLGIQRSPSGENTASSGCSVIGGTLSMATLAAARVDPHPGGQDGPAENPLLGGDLEALRSEEHTSELQTIMRKSYAVFRLK